MHTFSLRASQTLYREKQTCVCCALSILRLIIDRSPWHLIFFLWWQQPVAGPPICIGSLIRRGPFDQSASVISITLSHSTAVAVREKHRWKPSKKHRQELQHVFETSPTPWTRAVAYFGEDRKTNPTTSHAALRLPPLSAFAANRLQRHQKQKKQRPERGLWSPSLLPWRGN